MTFDLQFRGEGAGALRVFLASHLDGEQLRRQDVKKLLTEPKNALTTADFRLVGEILGELRTVDPTTPSLATLLRQRGGVKVCVVAVKEKEDEKTKEKMKKYLAKRRQKLLRLDEEMRYGSMVRNVKAQSATSELAHHQKNVRQHLSIGANMVMARITAFIAVYFVARNVTDNETTRMVAGLVGAIAMMVVEMVLFITRASKIESIEHEQRKHKNVF